VEDACQVTTKLPAHLVVAVYLSPVDFLFGTLMTDSELVPSQLRLLRDMGVG